MWKVCEIDLRVGGTWRYVIEDSDFEVGFHGEYQELSPPHRLVSTEVYEGILPTPPRSTSSTSRRSTASRR